ncbi:MAG: capsid cement protein [Bacillota bacterium]
MAKNYVQEGHRLWLTAGAGVTSGAPVAVGQITGVAVADVDANNQTTVDTAGVYDLSVKGINGGGNSAVVVGDAIYYTVGDTPKLNKKDNGVLFGYALEAVDAGATATINVKLK